MGSCLDRWQPHMPPAVSCLIRASTNNTICGSTKWGLEEVKSKKGRTSREAHRGWGPQIVWKHPSGWLCGFFLGACRSLGQAQIRWLLLMIWGWSFEGQMQMKDREQRTLMVRVSRKARGYSMDRKKDRAWTGK